MIASGNHNSLEGRERFEKTPAPRLLPAGLPRQLYDMGNNFPREAIQPELTRVRGVYPTCELDERRVRRLVCERRLAPLHEGKSDGGEQECPICMLL